MRGGAPAVEIAATAVVGVGTAATAVDRGGDSGDGFGDDGGRGDALRGGSMDLGTTGPGGFFFG
jgi:hypothetical protein